MVLQGAKTTERLREEKQYCLHALLNRPWVLKQDDPLLFQQIKDHYESLREWLHEYLDFSLIITRHFAKVEKIPGAYQSWMGISGFLTPRDYGLFTYGLWYLEGRGETEQFLLTQMVEEIKDHLLTMDVSIDWTLYEHRLSMARALKKLKELQVLITVDGDEADWAREGGGHDVLYECSPMTRYVLRRFPQELTSYPDLDSLTEEEEAETKEGKTRQRRRRVYRRLVQEPMVYDWQWAEEERYYVLTQRRSIMEHMREMLHLEGSRYREGLAFFYEEVTAEMDLFPTLSGISDLVMLVAGEIRKRLHRDPSLYDRDEWGRISISVTDLEAVILFLRERYIEYWGKEHRQASAQELVKQLLEHMEEWNLGRRISAEEILLYPALGRWNGDYEGKESEFGHE